MTSRKPLKATWADIEFHSIALESWEIVVSQADKPLKEKVREWLRREISERRPPPDISEIRRNLGWAAPRPSPEPRRRRKH